MQDLEKEGRVDVFYGDESGFCLTSAIPYGWQFPGEQVATQPRHSQRFNVLGFYNAATNELHAAAFQARLEAWQAQEVYIFYLPTDSSHLNKIETFWRKIKYEWLWPEAYTMFNVLKTAVWYILDRVGLQFTIQFQT